MMGRFTAELKTPYPLELSGIWGWHPTPDTAGTHPEEHWAFYHDQKRQARSRPPSATATATDLPCAYSVAGELRSSLDSRVMLMAGTAPTGE